MVSASFFATKRLKENKQRVQGVRAVVL